MAKRAPKRAPKRKPAAKRKPKPKPPASVKSKRRNVVRAYAVEVDGRDPLGTTPKICKPRSLGGRDESKRCVTMQLEYVQVIKDGRSKGWFGPYWYAYLRKTSKRYKVPGALVSVYVGKPTIAGGPPGLPTVGDAIFKLKARGAFNDTNG